MKIDCVFLDFGPLGTEFCKPLRRRLEVVDMTVETTIRGKKLCVPLDLDGRECLVITKSDLEKIKKGELR